MSRLAYDLAAREPWRDQDFPDAEYDARLARVRDGMARAGLDALVIYCGPASWANSRWLTNFAPIDGTVFIVVPAEGAMTVTMDGVLHGEPMHSMVWNCRVADLRCAAGPIFGGAPDEVAALAADALDGKSRVGLAGASTIPARLHATLAKRVPDLVTADAVMSGARLIKSPAEVRMMEEAGRIADAAFAAAFSAFAPDVRECEIAAAAVARMHALGAVESFPACVVGGPLAGLKHATPRQRDLVEGEMVLIDLGARYRGYRSDTSRCAVVGERPRGEARDLLAVAADLYHAGLGEMRPGRAIDDVARALTKVVRGGRWEKHFYETGFGHGVGMDIFEAPGGLFAGSRVELKPGMALAYEPMVAIEGFGAGVIGDTILITETGYRVLTNSPREV